MKTKLFLVAMMMLIFATSGCGPRFKNEAQYDKGEWGGYTDETTVAQIKRDKLAIAKLEASPALIGIINERGKTVPVTVNSGQTAPAGYMGKVANLSSQRRYKFKVSGPENKSWYLGPGQAEPDYLLPGVYTARLFYGGSETQAPMTLTVGPQKKNFLGEEVHWFFVAEY